MKKTCSYISLLTLLIAAVLTGKDQVYSSSVSNKNNAKYVPVLMYHSFDEHPKFTGINTTPKVFREHLTLLKKNGYTTITNRQMELYQKGYIMLPEKSFMITIDDGFESVYKIAYPILKELGMKATLFVITSYIESGERFGVQMASWEQLKEMSDSSYVEIGNHTHDFHWRGNNNQKGYEAMITNSTQDGEKITTKQRGDMIIKDLKIAHELILENVGIAPTAFSYPYGAYDKVAVTAVKKAGYTINHTIVEDMNYPNEGSEYIKRYGINNEVSSKRLLNKM